ncbi:unnamed protein product [Schistosoma curassoni]|uniref:Uncharacterized protein n=1 Tax=Schistosoma curassoni TaxID=6186 RepID=A0A183KC83_9TREM|nr:unnamed protein product [Schistosoma curassoni]
MTSEGKYGIQRTTRNQLEDLDFADDLAQISHTHEQLRTKTTSVAYTHNKGTSKSFEYNTENTNSIKLDGETLEDVKSSMYLESNIDEQERHDTDKDEDRQNKDRIPTIEERIELKTTINQHQSENLR